MDRQRHIQNCNDAQQKQATAVKLSIHQRSCEYYSSRRCVTQDTVARCIADDAVALRYSLSWSYSDNRREPSTTPNVVVARLWTPERVVSCRPPVPWSSVLISQREQL